MIFDSTSLRKLKAPALFGVALLVAVSGYYFLFLSQQTRYLNSRNFRLLTTIGSHIEEWGKSHRDRFKSLTSPDFWADPAEDPHIVSVLFTEPDGSVLMRVESESEALEVVKFDPELLTPLGAATQKDVFEKTFLATTGGRILAQSGESDLNLADLDSLLKPRDFRAESTYTKAVNVDLSGTAYKLFIQPCCKSFRVAATDSDIEPSDSRKNVSTSGVKATDSKNTDASRSGGVMVGAQTGTPKIRNGLVVCGLVQNSTLTQRGLSISFSTMIAIAGLLLMIVVSWPFMKLALIGPRQRVTLLDMLLLGVSSLLVVSIGTLYSLDLLAYYRLKSHVDRQLERLSVEIRSNVRREVAAAHKQLEVLQAAAVGTSKETLANLHDQSVLSFRELSFYPFFESFSLIDGQGKQQRKWTIHAQTTPIIPVEDRGYFRQSMFKGTWSLPADSGLPAIPAFALESIRSRTRGVNEAVLSVPTSSTDFPVAALSIPMISLINPVLPHGFGFAIIEDKDKGRVLFHSDEKRNLLEQFFLETDLNRRLRSAVAARRAELLDLQYWGRDYRAFAAPLEGFPTWSLITFHDKEVTRSVNVDWIVTTLLFLVAYVALYVIACVFVLLRPSRRATWLWPTPSGLTAYHQLALLYIVLILVFSAAIRNGPHPDLLGLAFILPLVAWILTYLRLRTGPPAAGPPDDARKAAPPQGLEDPSKGPSELLTWSYIWAAMLLFVLTAVIPTVAFFKVAHSVQVRPVVKYVQLTLAAALENRRQRLERELAGLSAESRAKVLPRRASIGGAQLEVEDTSGSRRSLPPVDVYHRFFFETSVKRLPDGDESPPVHGDHDSDDPLPASLEPILPYYSEFSVAIRELLHNEADDKTRWWKETEDGMTLWFTAYGDGDLEINSFVLPFWGPTSPLLAGLFVVMLGAGLALFVAWFAAGRVFLLDLPLWSPISVGFPTAGQSRFVICRSPDVKEAYLLGRKYRTVDLEQLAAGGVGQAHWDRALSELDKLLPGEPILVDHFEHGMYDKELSEKKLWLIEELVQIRRRKLVILSAIGLAPLQRGAKAAETAVNSAEKPSVEQRWAALLTSSFVIVDLDPRFETYADAGSDVPESITEAERAAAGSWWRLRLSAWVRRRQRLTVRRALERECRNNPYLARIYEDLSRVIRRMGQEGYDREQLLDELGERAENYYEGLWACCSPVEKLVLEHLAESGFANYKDRKAVRRLISRGLVLRDPHFRLMNETFRRFVLSTRCRTEVAEVEQRTRSSPWDRFRRPFAAVLVVVLLFFVTTQKDRFDTMMAVILGAAGVLPSVLKLAGLLLGERQGTPVKAD